jgi:hypothetical protein
VRVDITPDHLAQGHWFEFEIDQSYFEEVQLGASTTKESVWPGLATLQPCEPILLDGELHRSRRTAETLIVTCPTSTQ